MFLSGGLSTAMMSRSLAWSVLGFITWTYTPPRFTTSAKAAMLPAPAEDPFTKGPGTVVHGGLPVGDRWRAS